MRHAADRREQPGDVRAAQGGRRLVKHDDRLGDLCVFGRAERPGDRDDHAFGCAQPGHGQRGIDVEPYLVEQPAGGLTLPLPRDLAEAVQGERLDRDVLQHRHRLRQREVLMQDAEGVPARVVVADRQSEVHPVQGDPAAVRPMVAGQDLDQRGLARAVVAKQRPHLACLHLEPHAAQRLRRAEALVQVLHLEDGRRIGHCVTPRAANPVDEASPYSAVGEVRLRPFRSVWSR